MNLCTYILRTLKRDISLKERTCTHRKGKHTAQSKEKLCIVVEDMELKAFNLDSTIDGNKYVVDLIERMKQTYIKAVQNLGEKNV